MKDISQSMKLERSPKTVPSEAGHTHLANDSKVTYILIVLNKSCYLQTTISEEEKKKNSVHSCYWV